MWTVYDVKFILIYCCSFIKLCSIPRGEMNSYTHIKIQVFIWRGQEQEQQWTVHLPCGWVSDLLWIFCKMDYSRLFAEHAGKCFHFEAATPNPDVYSCCWSLWWIFFKCQTVSLFEWSHCFMILVWKSLWLYISVCLWVCPQAAKGDVA